MVRTKKIKVETEKKVEPKVEKNSYDVLDKNGNFVRTYSKEIQGERFAEYAKIYAEKIQGTFK